MENIGLVSAGGRSTPVQPRLIEFGLLRRLGEISTNERRRVGQTATSSPAAPQPQKAAAFKSCLVDFSAGFSSPLYSPLASNNNASATDNAATTATSVRIGACRSSILSPAQWSFSRCSLPSSAAMLRLGKRFCKMRPVYHCKI
jgi:hypothetical protein